MFSTIFIKNRTRFKKHALVHGEENKYLILKWKFKFKFLKNIFVEMDKG